MKLLNYHRPLPSRHLSRKVRIVALRQMQIQQVAIRQGLLALPTGVSVQRIVVALVVLHGRAAIPTVRNITDNFSTQKQKFLKKAQTPQIFPFLLTFHPFPPDHTC